MRRLILTDIHGNIDALQSVLADAAGQFDEIHCLGDLAGYGGAPAEVIEWARGNTKSCVRGNHDRACSTREGLSDFNPTARAAALWTRHTLDKADLDWLAALPKGPLQFDGFELAHGSPADEDEYLLSIHDAACVEKQIMRPICFVGHTHLQRGWMWDRAGIHALDVPTIDEHERAHVLSPDSLYLVNPGSVGQPRDRNPRAAYVLWDDERRLLTFRRTSYDVTTAQLRIIAAGLDPWLAERLAKGV